MNKRISKTEIIALCLIVYAGVEAYSHSWNNFSQTGNTENLIASFVKKQSNEIYRLLIN